jgi:hypothetical protein
MLSWSVDAEMREERERMAKLEVSFVGMLVARAKVAKEGLMFSSVRGKYPRSLEITQKGGNNRKKDNLDCR